MSKSILLKHCKSIINNNKEIFNFISSFLELKGKDQDGNVISFYDERQGIPPVGFLSITLLNIYCSIIDQEFTRAYPKLPYFRYFNETYILVPLNHVEEFDLFLYLLGPTFLFMRLYRY